MAEPAAFFRRPFPSANAVLLRGPRPVLVDGGFGADVPALLAWLDAQGMPAARLALVVNTHWDCDHAGANHALAALGVPIAAGIAEGAAVNRADPAACRARFLAQPVEAYRVDRLLAAGDAVDTGLSRWTVLDTPGHTDGHISLHCAEHGLLVTGDAVHADDLGWVDATRPGALDAAEDTVARLGTLRLAAAFSGHGPVTADPASAFATAARRLAGWRRDPARMGWHGAKRVLAYNLMVDGPMAEAALHDALPRQPWFAAYAAIPFGLSPAAFVAPLLAEMERSGAARWDAGRLTPTAGFMPPPPGWAAGPVRPEAWR